MNVITETHRTH